MLLAILVLEKMAHSALGVGVEGITHVQLFGAELLALVEACPFYGRLGGSSERFISVTAGPLCLDPRICGDIQINTCIHIYIVVHAYIYPNTYLPMYIGLLSIASIEQSRKHTCRDNK